MLCGCELCTSREYILYYYYQEEKTLLTWAKPHANTILKGWVNIPQPRRYVFFYLPAPPLAVYIFSKFTSAMLWPLLHIKTANQTMNYLNYFIFHFSAHYSTTLQPYTQFCYNSTIIITYNNLFPNIILRKGVVWTSRRQKYCVTIVCKEIVCKKPEIVCLFAHVLAFLKIKN